MRAAKEFGAKQIIVAGGVAANKGLRKVWEEAVSKEKDLVLTFPSFKYCTDNAAMIGVAGYFQDKCKK
jgi:N6-L-threonylcarbamoyladenine synthase